MIFPANLEPYKNSSHSNSKFHKSHAEFVGRICKELRQLKRAGYQLFFVTLVYKPPRTTFVRSNWLREQLNTFRRKVLIPLITHRRNYDRPRYRDLHPIIYAFPDAPGSKLKRSVYPMIPGSPDHHHMIVAVRDCAASQMEMLVGLNTLCLPLHLDRRKPVLVMTSDVQEITPGTEEKVTSYAAKYALSQQLKMSDWFIELGPSVTAVLASRKTAQPSCLSESRSTIYPT